MIGRLVLFLLISAATCAQAATAKIVGVGASTCARFNEDISRNPESERDYLGWAEGFMSGALMRSPPGVDEDLDLAPESFPLQRQADFLRDFCTENPGKDYMDAVLALYRRLRGPAT